MNQLPKVSIVCRTYNHAKFIGYAINSVLAQTFQDFELVISDDCSSDDTVKIIESYKDTRIRLLKNKTNMGVVANLNKVLGATRGEYIAILDGDDFYDSQKLEKQVNFLDNNYEFGAVFSYIGFVDKENKQCGSSLAELINRPSKSRAEMLAEHFFHQNFLAFPTEMFRRKFLMAFPENLIAMGDQNFHIHILLNAPIKVLEEPLTFYRILNDGSQTSTWFTTLSNEIEKFFILDNYLHLKDLHLFEGIFKGHYEEYGEPTIEAIPYFVARIAQSVSHLSPWGHYSLSKLFSSQSYFNYISQEYGLLYKDYVELKKAVPHDLSVTEKIKILGFTILKKKYKKTSTKYYLFGTLLVGERKKKKDPKTIFPTT